MDNRTRILVIDNLAVESSRRAVYRALANRSDFEVHLLTPKSWREQGEAIACEEEKDSTLRVHQSRFFFGYRVFPGFGFHRRWVWAGYFHFCHFFFHILLHA